MVHKHTSYSVRVLTHQCIKMANTYIKIQNWYEKRRWELSSKTNTETLKQQKSNTWTPMGPTQDRISSPNQLRFMLSLTLLLVLMLLCVVVVVVVVVFSVLFSIVITSLGEEREPVYMLLVHLYVYLGVGVGFGLWLWRSLDFSFNFFNWKSLSLRPDPPAFN